MKIVDFGNGKYGIRKICLFKLILEGHLFVYYDFASSSEFWWSKNEYTRDTKSSLENVLDVYKKLKPDKIQKEKKRIKTISVKEALQRKQLEDMYNSKEYKEAVDILEKELCNKKIAT